jgi:hypothetical protein
MEVLVDSSGVRAASLGGNDDSLSVFIIFIHMQKKYYRSTKITAGAEIDSARPPDTNMRTKLTG